jgi:SAM-dependent methyltransferase
MTIELMRPCPVCAATTGTVLHHQVYVAPKELQAPPEVDIVACDRCGVCFADLPTPQEVLDEAYRDHSKYADTSLYDETDPEEHRPPSDAPWDLQRLAGTAAWLAQNVSLSSRVLDAGCATGALLGYLQQEGFTDLVGLDPSPIATATAARTYHVSTVTGSFFSPPDDLGLFDLVVLSHVLEHLSDVRGAVAGMWALTKPGGSVYIEVPDAARYADHLVAPFHDFNTEHINHFSGTTLRLAMELAGFETTLVSHKLVLCSPSDAYPAAFGLFRRPTEAAPAPVIERDDDLVEAVNRYVDASARLLDELGTRIHDSVGTASVVVWGAGQLSMRLLAGPIKSVDVAALVDTSESKWGQHYGDLMVVGPEQIDDDGAPILITSIHHQESIEQSVRSRFPDRAVITLRD